MNPELIRGMAELSGLSLSVERAAALIPALEPVFAGDALVAALGLGTLSPLGLPWNLELTEVKPTGLESPESIETPSLESEFLEAGLPPPYRNADE